MRVDAIEVKGLSRTKPFVVLRELPFHVGDIVTATMIDEATRRLWNTPLFARVAIRIVRRVVVVVVVDLEERWPITPLLEFQSGGNATWLHLGVSHRNVFGRYLEAEGFYEYFNGVGGGDLSFRNARLFDQRLELRVVADRLMRPRPSYVVRTTRGRIELNRLVLDDYVKYGIRVDVLNDEFFQPLSGATPVLPSTMQAAIVEPAFRIGRVDNVRLRDQGVSLETRAGLGYTTRKNAALFHRFTMELNANAMAGQRWNFGIRAIAGTISTSPDQMQFFVGGLDLLRGYPDNYFQANAYGLYNADIKFIVFDTTWLAMLPALFSDGAVIRRGDGTRHAAMSVGTGLIFVIPKFADSQLRIDLAVPLRPPYHPGIGLGSAAFF